MQRVIIKDNNGNIVLEKEYRFEETIKDIKKWIVEKNEAEAQENIRIQENTIKMDTEDVAIIFNGKIIEESIPITSLANEKDLYVNFVLKSKSVSKQHTSDVEMNSIDTMRDKQKEVKYLQNGRKFFADSKDLIDHNGVLYFVKQRKIKTRMVDNIRKYLVGFNIQLFIKFFTVIALFATKNKEFAFLLLLIFFLRVLGSLPLKLSINISNRIDSLFRTVFYFFLSIFLMNFEQILVVENKTD